MVCRGVPSLPFFCLSCCLVNGQIDDLLAGPVSELDATRGAIDLSAHTDPQLGVVLHPVALLVGPAELALVHIKLRVVVADDSADLTTVVH